MYKHPNWSEHFRNSRLWIIDWGREHIRLPPLLQVAGESNRSRHTWNSMNTTCENVKEGRKVAVVGRWIVEGRTRGWYISFFHRLQPLYLVCYPLECSFFYLLEHVWVHCFPHRLPLPSRLLKDISIEKLTRRSGNEANKRKIWRKKGNWRELYLAQLLVWWK